MIHRLKTLFISSLLPHKLPKLVEETSLRDALLLSFLSSLVYSIGSFFLDQHLARSFVYLTTPVFLFAASIVVHLALKYFKGRASVFQTTKAFLYSLIILLLLGWIKPISFVVSAYSFFVLVYTLSKIHDLSILKTFLAFFLLLFSISFFSLILGLTYYLTLSVLF